MTNRGNLYAVILSEQSDRENLVVAKSKIRRFTLHSSLSTLKKRACDTIVSLSKNRDCHNTSCFAMTNRGNLYAVILSEQSDRENLVVAKSKKSIVSLFTPHSSLSKNVTLKKRFSTTKV